MMNKGNIFCPKCGLKMQSRGKVKRSIKGPNGLKETIMIQRYSCRVCKTWHRVQQDNLLPYKQYSKDIINGFINDELTSEDIRFEDYPSESTQKRWKCNKPKTL